MPAAGIALFVVLLMSNSAFAATLEALSKSEAAFFSALYLVFPGGEDGVEQPKLKNDTPWDIRIWATNDAEECTYQNQSLSCKRMVIYVSIVEEVGGEVYAFKTTKAFHWSVQSIETARDINGRLCARLVLRERKIKPALQKRVEQGDETLFLLRDDELWDFPDTVVCVAQDGFHAIR